MVMVTKPLLALLALSMTAGFLACSGDDDPSGGDGDDDGSGGTLNGGDGDDSTAGGTSGDGDAPSSGGETASGGGSTGGNGGDDEDCNTPPNPPPLIGWASEAGGTTGGGAQATPIVVSDAISFMSVITGNEPRVIHVKGSISTDGRFEVGSNKTIIGICDAELRGSVEIDGRENVIMRNLRVVGKNCEDSPTDCSDGDDAIGVRSSHHLWFDHLEVLDGSDGNLDMTNDTDYVTISWTKFYYTGTQRDHRFANLIGGSDSDSGEYRITFHHNWWAENVDQRMPRTRFGDIHVFNNLYTSSGNSYCTNAGFSTSVLVENNVYLGVHNPLSPDDNGVMEAIGNYFDDAVTGTTSDNDGDAFEPPYDYSLDPTDGLDALIQSEVGPHD